MPSRAKCDRRRITAGARAIDRHADGLLRRHGRGARRLPGRMNQFLSVLEQDASAVDRLLYAAKMETWMALRPRSRAPSGLATTSPRRTARCRTMSFGVTGTLAAGWSCYPGQVSLVFPVAARFGE